MAKESTNLDKFFREKLSTHQEKPSALAWERLESKLPQQSKSNPGIWWAAAASVIILLSASYFLIRDGENGKEPVFVAANQPTESTSEISPPTIAAFAEVTAEEATKTTAEKTETEKTKPTISKPINQSAKSSNSSSIQSEKLIAQEKVNTHPEAITASKANSIVIDPIEVRLPEFNQIAINETVAVQVKVEQIEEPTYKVTIYSDGIKEADKNLIAELGKKVEKVEGLLGKVDQGFSDLQDAKNNLFLSLITKKERAGDSR
jgi:hypothetical protein